MSTADIQPIEVLLVEDSPADVQLLKIKLMRREKVSFNLHVATNGREAMRLLEERARIPQEPQIDLMLLDINMPIMDGFEVLHALSADERLNRIPVCILSTSNDESDMQRARDLGALAYLVKPYQKSDLIPAIEVAIGRFRELQSLSGEVDALEEQLESRKLIDRAKGILLDECNMKEQEAFTFLQRTAMSERGRMRDVAERVIAGTLRPPQPD